MITSLIRTGRADLDGTYTTARDCVLVPPARADLPILIASKRPRMLELTARHADGNIDVPRMRQGGLSAIFFSIWIPGKTLGPEAVKQALVQIDAVREPRARRPDQPVFRGSNPQHRFQRGRQGT